MSDGKTHDKITWLTTAVLATMTAYITMAGDYSIELITAFWLLVFCYWFSGFMFNGDLDIWSEPTKRWGILHIYWWPYRKTFKHRSFWTHGLIAGTLIRVIWCAPIIIPFTMFVYTPTQMQWVYILVGLEAGAMSHTVMDKVS